MTSVMAQAGPQAALHTDGTRCSWPPLVERHTVRHLILPRAAARAACEAGLSGEACAGTSQALCPPTRRAAVRGLPCTLGVAATHAGALRPGVLRCSAWEARLTCACVAPKPLLYKPLFMLST